MTVYYYPVLIRDGFRSRLENIFRNQANGNPDASSNNHAFESLNDQAEASVPDVIEIGHSDQSEQPSDLENHTPLLDTNGNTDININGDDAVREETGNQGDEWQEYIAEDESTGWQQSTYEELNEWRNRTEEDIDGAWQSNSVSDWHQPTSGNAVAEEGELPETRQVWQGGGIRGTQESWSGGPSSPTRTRRAIPARRLSRFHPPDDDNVYNMELRELLSRRSVSTLLRSGFRESLDQLIQSYVERQGRGPLDWDLHRNLPAVASAAQDDDQRDVQNEGDSIIARPSLVLPSPPAPPPQPLWHQDLHHHANWSRQSLHRPELEWEMINDLRTDVARLQQGMNHMQRMLEACMDMQLELQRSVRQEVSAALNRSNGGKGGVGGETSEDGSKWGHVRKGACCVCCDHHIDSLLYRCGHMCTCLKCANELVRRGGKCPLCRAPIIEVIRAYSIL
ncbi:hypothetical protein Dimus_021302 [Dionaea muscipula]